jgi:hypothetical protein
MPINDVKKGRTMRSLTRALACGAFFCLMFAIYQHAPLYTFNPFCTYDLAYRLNVTIEVEGKQYASEVVNQSSRPRGWVSLINPFCHQTVGTAIPFRLGDNRLVLMSSYICPKARQAFTRDDYYPRDFSEAIKERRKIDLASLCIGIHRNQLPSRGNFSGYDAFVIENADNPMRWRGLKLDSANAAENLRIVSAVAEAGDLSSEDHFDTVAPAILKTSFKYRNWSDSPEVILDFSRRYGPDKRFTYTAEEEQQQTP